MGQRQLHRVRVLLQAFDRDTLADVDATTARDAEERGVERTAAHHGGVRPVGRERKPGAMTRRRHEYRLAHEHRLGSGQLAGRNAQRLQESQRVRGQPVAAGLVARKARLVDAHDPQSPRDRGDRGRSSRGSRPHHDDVDALGHRSRPYRNGSRSAHFGSREHESRLTDEDCCPHHRERHPSGHGVDRTFVRAGRGRGIDHDGQ